MKKSDTITNLLREYLRRTQTETVNLLDDFPKQNAFVEDKGRYLIAQCSRRAGKTNGLALRFFRTMENHPNATCRYLSLTRESAKSIMWPVLQELNDKYALGCIFTESNLTMHHPNGSRLQLYGADMSNFIKRLKGTKSPGIAIDEAQDFGLHLKSLIDDVLVPTLVDYKDSWIALTGTPGPVPQGYFFESTQQGKYGYQVHKWTILDNPHVFDPSGFIEEYKAKNQWEDDNATLRREWRNEWVLDVQSLWVRYSQARNDYNALPQLPWRFVMGIDLGFKDNDAIAILAQSDATQEIYLVEEWLANKQGITELVTKIEEFNKKYKVDRMVIDEGGLGKKIAEEIRRRWSIPVQQADKMRKQENVELLNDSLRLGNFRAKRDTQFVKDSYLVQIDWDKSRNDKIIIKKHPHSDIIDAVLYAFKECTSYTYTKPVQKPDWGTKEYWENVSGNMFEEAVARATSEAVSPNEKDLEDYRKGKF